MQRSQPDIERRSTLLSIHGWSAVLLGLLAYIVIVSGMVSVFATQIGHWTSPLERQPLSGLPTGLGSALNTLAGEIDPEYHEDVSVFAWTGGRLTTFFHTHRIHPQSGDVEEYGVELDLDPRTFEILDRRTGWGDDILSRNQASGLAVFLTNLHIRLQLPELFGLLLTGLVGFALMVAVVTGIIVHRHLLRDLFTLRGRKQSPLQARDTHVVAGSWILPFVFVLAFTGSYFSFSDTIGFPVLADVVFDGDEVAMFETVFGVPLPEDATPAGIADLDAIIADVGRRGGGAPVFLTVEGLGRADSVVTLLNEPQEGGLLHRSYVYSGVDGEFLGEKPLFGTQPSIGGIAAEMMGPLHFGDFAGVVSQAVWFALGFVGAYLTFSGLRLWCTRHREGAGWKRFERGVFGVGYGLPVALATVPYAYFMARAAGLVMTHNAMMTAFLLAAGLSLLAAFALRELETVKRALWGLTGILLVGLPFARLLTGGPGWVSGIQHGLHAMLAVDLMLLAGGILYIFLAVRQRPGIASRVSPVRAATAESRS